MEIIPMIQARSHAKAQAVSNVRAEFFRGPHGRDMVRIAIIGDPSVYEGRAEAAHLARFPREFAAYEAGRPVEAPAGIPLEAVPGIVPAMAASWRGRGVRTAQELAALSDHAVKGLGLGALGARKAARELLAQDRAADTVLATDPTPESPTDPAPEPPTDPAPESPTDPAPESPTDPAPDAPTIPDLVPPADDPARASRARGRP
jgi:hypothetical protein